MTKPEPTIVACAHCGKRNRTPAVAAGIPRCGSCHAHLPWVTDAHETDFGAIVQTSLLVLVDLWAPWCGPCRTVSPLIEQAARERAGQLKVVKVNVDDSPALSRKFSVQGIPTILLLRDGQEVSRQVGALPGHALRSWIDLELTKKPTQP